MNEVKHYPTELRSAVREFTLAHIKHVIALHGGNKTRAAQALGVSRRTLQLKLWERITSNLPEGSPE